MMDMNPMKPGVKAAWTKTLLSKEYRQAAGVLLPEGDNNLHHLRDTMTEYPVDDYQDIVDSDEYPHDHDEDQPSDTLRLVYLPANQRWVFTFGDGVIRLEGEHFTFPLFYETRREAVTALRECGLVVDNNGTVVIIQGDQT